MSNTKIQDEAEVVRWHGEGRTYKWMAEEYERKYNLSVAPSMFGNFRRRKGLPRRIQRNDELLPWLVEAEHRHLYAAQMLRAEGRRRAGVELRDGDAQRLEAWLEKLKTDDLVVHYDPETERGFFYVPRRPGVDDDLVREPEAKTTPRRSTD